VLWTSLGWTQQPKPGGTLRLAMPGDMTFFNANQGPAPGYFTFWVWNNLFNSLLTMTPPPEAISQKKDTRLRWCNWANHNVPFR